VITCVDQETGVKDGSQPLLTLNKFRMHSQVYGYRDDKFKAPLFGSNYGVIKTGHVRVGDVIYIKP
jgi:uncharacterized protein YcbX